MGKRQSKRQTIFCRNIEIKFKKTKKWKKLETGKTHNKYKTNVDNFWLLFDKKKKERQKQALEILKKKSFKMREY